MININFHTRGFRYAIAVSAAALFCIAFAPVSAYAATNINANSSEHWAWNDTLGWIDFYHTNTVTLTSAVLQGYASSSAGSISFDCNTSPSGNICSSGNGDYQVANNAGTLTGWAWNDEIGWISFSCQNTASCGTAYYGVTVDGGGNFQNFAWNDVVGWIDFNCDNITGACASSNYEVQTSWAATSSAASLDSATYDTGVVSGAQLNSVTWQGNLPVGTAVAFQFAVSNSSSGPWNFTGPDGTAGTTWPGGNPGSSTALTAYAQYQNFRYFRYRVILDSNPAQTLTPRVDGVIINWSP